LGKPLTDQLRVYDLRPGSLDKFLHAFWDSDMLQIRHEFGFVLAASWSVLGEDRFVWVVRHDGDADAFARAEEAYYASPRRIQLDPNPADFVMAGTVSLMAAVSPDQWQLHQ
jgi:hypothetical protein